MYTRRNAGGVTHKKSQSYSVRSVRFVRGSLARRLLGTRLPVSLSTDMICVDSDGSARVTLLLLLEATDPLRVRFRLFFRFALTFGECILIFSDGCSPWNGGTGSIEPVQSASQSLVAPPPSIDELLKLARRLVGLLPKLVSTRHLKIASWDFIVAAYRRVSTLVRNALRRLCFDYTCMKVALTCLLDALPVICAFASGCGAAALIRYPCRLLCCQSCVGFRALARRCSSIPDAGAPRCADVAAAMRVAAVGVRALAAGVPRRPALSDRSIARSPAVRGVLRRCRMTGLSLSARPSGSSDPVHIILCFEGEGQS